jgi:hypothetical protein
VAALLFLEIVLDVLCRVVEVTSRALRWTFVRASRTEQRGAADERDSHDELKYMSVHRYALCGELRIQAKEAE